MLSSNLSANDLVAGMFNVREASYVSKGALIKKVHQQNSAIERLAFELFCANPSHEVFKNSPEEQLAVYRRAQLKRKEKKG